MAADGQNVSELLLGVPLVLQYNMATGGYILVTTPLAGAPTTVYIASGTVGETPLGISVTPTISTGIYAAGDALGGKLTFPNAAREAGGGGTITKVVVIDNNIRLAPVDLVLFDRDFTATVDNLPFQPSAADKENCIGYIDVAATDYATFSGSAVAAKASGLRMPFDYDLAAGVTSLFGQMVVRGTPTYLTATGVLTARLTVQR